MADFCNMAHTEITNWLNQSNPNFKKGVYLLKTFSKDMGGISAAILRSDTSFSRRKITKALTAINKGIPNQVTMKPERAPISHKYGHTKGYPPHLVELESQIPILNSELNGLANKKHDLPEGDALRDLALDIVERYHEIRQIWARLDYFAEFGMDMPGTAPNSHQADLIDELVEWLDIQPALIDYSRRHKNSKDPAKKAEAKRRQHQLDVIAAFIKAHRDDCK